MTTVGVKGLISPNAVKKLFRLSQANLQELVVDESDPRPASLILYSNLPITCQDVTSTGTPIFCFISFAIKSTEDIAMRQRLPSGSYPGAGKGNCTYQLKESDWNEDEGLASDNRTSLDIVAKVTCV